jgi:cardiolipin synthase
MSTHWVSGNHVTLLVNGEAFFPRVFECIAAAEREILLETFILFEDKVGLALQAALRAAARRGVQIDITIDGYGSPDLSPGFISALTQAGVRVHVFDPSPRLWGYRTNLFRRMHRKIVTIDGTRAFVGGINYSADHLADFGPSAKQDYTLEIEGPLVAPIQHFARAQLLMGQGEQPSPRHRLFGRAPDIPTGITLPAAGNAEALFVTRDNRDHKNDIERHYRIAIRGARNRIFIANAYFFPPAQAVAPGSAARRGRAADPAGRARHANCQSRGQPALPPSTERGREDIRIPRATAARQDRTHRRRMVDGGLEQPRPVKPVTQPGSQRHHQGPSLQPAHGRTPGATDARQLPGDSGE